MKLIYSNFDGLDISFQCALPEEVLEQLEHGRNEAESNRQSTLVHLGKNEVSVHVAETGARGGYRYRFDMGLDRETWFVAKSTNPELWNIRVSAKSASLAIHGYFGTKKNILETLKLLGAHGKDQIDENTGEISSLPRERISRFDMCFDFETESFIPNPDHVICHNRSKKKQLYNNEGELIFSGTGLIYLRIGTMPNRQIVFYDKIKEITEKNKKYWFKIWDINPKNFRKKIWRIEARAGKKELNKWDLRTFGDFENKAGDVIAAILKDNKYVIPNNDKNRSRWPLAEFWVNAINEVNKNFNNFISHAKRNEIISVIRKEKIETYKKHIAGMATPLSVALGNESISEIPGVLDGVKKDLELLEKLNPSLLTKKKKQSEDKFIFLDDKKSES